MRRWRTCAKTSGKRTDENLIEIVNYSRCKQVEKRHLAGEEAVEHGEQNPCGVEFTRGGVSVGGY